MPELIGALIFAAGFLTGASVTQRIQAGESPIAFRLPITRAKVIPPTGEASPSLLRETQDAREKYVREAMAEGHSEKAAREDWDAMMGRSITGQDAEAWS